MPPMNDDPLTGTVLDDSAELTLEDLSRMCAVDERHIVEYVEEGVLTVLRAQPQWRFSGGALRRARLALRLEHDLELNLAGVALALDLIQELQQLRHELHLRRQ